MDPIMQVDRVPPTPPRAVPSLATTKAHLPLPDDSVKRGDRVLCVLALVVQVPPVTCLGPATGLVPVARLTLQPPLTFYFPSIIMLPSMSLSEP